MSVKISNMPTLLVGFVVALAASVKGGSNYSPSSASNRYNSYSSPYVTSQNPYNAVYQNSPNVINQASQSVSYTAGQNAPHVASHSLPYTATQSVSYPPSNNMYYSTSYSAPYVPNQSASYDNSQTSYSTSYTGSPNSHSVVSAAPSQIISYPASQPIPHAAGYTPYAGTQNAYNVMSLSLPGSTVSNSGIPYTTNPTTHQTVSHNSPYTGNQNSLNIVSQNVPYTASQTIHHAPTYSTSHSHATNNVLSQSASNSFIPSQSAPYAASQTSHYATTQGVSNADNAAGQNAQYVSSQSTANIPSQSAPYAANQNALYTTSQSIPSATNQNTQYHGNSITYTVPQTDFDYLRQYKNGHYHYQTGSSQQASSTTSTGQDNNYQSQHYAGGNGAQYSKVTGNNDHLVSTQSVTQESESNNLHETHNTGYHSHATSVAAPVVTKHIYFHVPPPGEDERSAQTIPATKAKKIYNIVFIKAPDSQESRRGSNLQGISAAAQQPPVEHKTIIYVLVKKPEAQPHLQLQSQTSSQVNSQHEVFYVKYRGDVSEVANQINEKLSQQSGLQGSSTGLHSDGQTVIDPALQGAGVAGLQHGLQPPLLATLKPALSNGYH